MRYFCVIFALLTVLLTPAYCAENILPLDDLAKAAGTHAPTQSVAELDFTSGLTDLLETGSNQLFGIFRKAIGSGVLLLTVVLFCGLAEGAYLGQRKGLDVTTMVGVLAITAIAVTDVNALIGMGRNALEALETFAQILLPTMTLAVAASGAPSTAAAQQFATMVFSNLLMVVIIQLLLPLSYGYIAATVAYAALGNEGLKRIAGLLKWVVTTALTILLVAYIGYLGVTGVIAGTTDALAVKTAKLAVSSMVPVVGSILSDATETVLVGAGILKNGVGVFGMLVILSICLLPFLQLGVHYLVYKLTAALAATVAQGRLAQCIDGIGGAFGLVLGMTGACAVLLLVSMVAGVSMVAP